MTPEQLIKKIRVIRESNPQNLMARYFDSPFYGSLAEPLRHRLRAVIASGIANPDSRMGAYAMHSEDYDLFATMLDPMIREYHGIPAGTRIAHRYDWDTQGTSWDIEAIKPGLAGASIRIRAARNLSGFPLPGAMDRLQRLALEDIARRAFTKLQSEPVFGGRYLSLTPGSTNEISAAKYERWVSAHQMFADVSGDRYLKAAGIGADWPHGRGMYVSRSQDFQVWVGEEDHLRIIVRQLGGTLNSLLGRLHTRLEVLRALLPDFVTSRRYGNVTSCPTNLGSGLRASLHLQLPRMTLNGRDMTRLKFETKALGLAVRGVGGEHSSAGTGGLVDISPRSRLGETEREIINRLYEGVVALCSMETS